MAFRDGDGWVYCTCGHRHWGLHGAAGLLLIRLDMNEPHVLLQLRAAWTHGGGTWALPGGALDSHEDSIAAAQREAQEEAGIDPSKFLVRDVFSDDHGPWRYDTVIAHAQGEIGAFEANAESDDLQWVALSSVETFELHAGLAGAWPQLHERVRSTL
ncbi:MAG: NUDIX hydrolase [Actinobacteria bacterium]|nr:NUDIX hydrolase [Actinomycetota bacterium]NDD86566.1 NUDIX hydrolase [Actinomycetota bacterium]NDF41271.1 NUDIX hydrolase [Actinomycetota bacterium]